MHLIITNRKELILTRFLKTGIHKKLMKFSHKNRRKHLTAKSVTTKRGNLIKLAKQTHNSRLHLKTTREETCKSMRKKSTKKNLSFKKAKS